MQDEEEIKFKDEREISAHMKRLREKFYEFHGKYISQTNPKPFFNELKKDLLVKLDQVLDADTISDYYDKILQRTAFTIKPGRRSWTEEENLLLISVATYICKAEEKDFTSLVSNCCLLMFNEFLCFYIFIICLKQIVIYFEKYLINNFYF